MDVSSVISGGYIKSTAALKEIDRLDYWRDLVCREYVQLECNKVDSNDFEGELRGGVSIADLRFSEVISCPQFVQRTPEQIAKAREADFLISFQLRNRGLIKQNGREAHLTPGSFALYDSTEPYSLTFNEPFHHFVVQMPKTILSRHLLHPERYTAIPISARSGLGAVLLNFLLTLAKELQHVRQAPEELSENLLNMIGIALNSSIMLEEVWDHSIVRETLKRRIRQYIENNLYDPNLSNNHIAEAQGISLRYLNKLFEDEAENVHAVILNKRLEKAQKLLADPAYAGHSIERVSSVVGFSSAAHFSRSFKKHYGVNPSDIR